MIPHVKSKGAASRKVVQKLFHMRREADGLNPQAGGDSSNLSRHEIDSLIMYAMIAPI